MNRQIKFRVWDKKRKQTYYKIHSVHFQCYNDGSSVIKSVHCNNDAGELINLKGLNGGNDFYLMQFTGLHDKNGKEIWDGDFIHHDNVKEPLQVYWCDATGQWKLGHEEPMRYYGPLYQYPNNLLEVIGSIYENPELLGEENE